MTCQSLQSPIAILRIKALQKYGKDTLTLAESYYETDYEKCFWADLSYEEQEGYLRKATLQLKNDYSLENSIFVLESFGLDIRVLEKLDQTWSSCSVKELLKKSPQEIVNIPGIAHSMLMNIIHSVTWFIGVISKTPLLSYDQIHRPTRNACSNSEN